MFDHEHPGHPLLQVKATFSSLILLLGVDRYKRGERGWEGERDPNGQGKRPVENKIGWWAVNFSLRINKNLRIKRDVTILGSRNKLSTADASCTV